MKTNVVLIPIIVMLALVGCSSEDVERDRVINKGISAIKKKSFDDATDIFANQLNKNGDDEQIRSLYRQAKCLKNATRLKEEERYKEALREFKYIDGVSSGSPTTEKYLEELKVELESKMEEQVKAEEERKLKAKEVAASDTIKAEKELEEGNNISGIMSEIFNPEKVEKVKDVLNGLKDKIGNLIGGNK